MYNNFHSASSSTKVSHEDIPEDKPISSDPSLSGKKSSDAEEPRTVVTLALTHTGFSTEEEREQHERDEAVNIVSPRAEYEGKPEEEREIQDKKADHFLVVWDENDPINPKTWSKGYRWWLTFASSLLVLNASFASSAPSGIAPQMVEEFGLSRIEGTLTISLFIAGYCVGPLFWGPLSEQYGRRPFFIISFFLYTLSQVACALAPNGPSMLVFRFLAGCFTACPLTNSGAILADIWDADLRGTAMAIFTLAPFAGPALGPIVGGYVALSSLDWRWVFWILAIFAGVCFVMIIFGMPETYGPVLLVRKAQKIRKEGGDKRYTAALERQNLHWIARIKQVLGRPFKVLALEPMLQVITLYMSFAYGLLYLLFLAYPVVFVRDHGFNAGESGLTFLPLFIGGAMGVALYIFCFAPAYDRINQQYAPEMPPPEARLPMSMWGGPLMVISMLWFGWTSFTSINPWAPILSGLILGISLVLIFLSLFSYMVDAYLHVAASALASSTVIRSLFGAGFPLFGNQMYTALNPRIASTVLACVALLLVPVPFVLVKWGPALRKKSRYAPTPVEGLKPHGDEQA